MAYTIKTAMRDESIDNPRKLISEYQFRLRDLSPAITIRLYKPVGGKGIEFEQSHYIKTPTQIGPYITSRKWGDYEAYALHLAITSITQYYKEAVSEGHVPNNSWLIANEHF